MRPGPDGPDPGFLGRAEKPRPSPAWPAKPGPGRPTLGATVAVCPNCDEFLQQTVSLAAPYADGLHGKR